MTEFIVDEIETKAEMKLVPVEVIQLGYTARSPVEGVDPVDDSQTG